MPLHFIHDNQLSDDEIKYLKLQAKKFERHDEVLGQLIFALEVLILYAFIMGIIIGYMGGRSI